MHSLNMDNHLKIKKKKHTSKIRRENKHKCRYRSMSSAPYKSFVKPFPTNCLLGIFLV